MKLAIVAVATCFIVAAPASGKVDSGQMEPAVSEIQQARDEIARLKSGPVSMSASGTLEMSSVFDTQAGASVLSELPNSEYAALRRKLTKCSHTKNAAARGATWAHVPAFEASSTNLTTCLLKRGHDFGPEPVYALQRAMNQCYGQNVRDTGNFGHDTEAALKDIQRKLGLVADGHYGPKTRSKMKWPTYKHDGKCQRLR